MVNAGTPCDHGPIVRTILAAAALVLGLAACSQGSERELARYYDPEGHFATSLPAANDLSVTPPQPSQGGPTLLTGVVATPPQASPSPQPGFGGGAVAGSETVDQTIYQAFVVTTDTFETVEQMSLFFLTGDPAIDVVLDDPVRVDGQDARLVVADVRQQGTVTASWAAAFALGTGEPRTGFLIAAVFPPGGWDDERRDFLRVLDSFRTGVPPGLAAFPMSRPAA
jgi:hypothetical protein